MQLVEDQDIIAVDPLSPSQALALFEKKLDSVGKRDEHERLLNELDFIPLAIVQAAAYLRQRAPRYSIREYLEDFRKSDRKKTSLLNYAGNHLRRDEEAKNSIIITWQISFEHIQQIRPSAADLLSLMSFFDRHGIPELLLQNQARTEEADRGRRQPSESDNKEQQEDSEDSASQCSNGDFEDDVQLLRSYSFLSCNKDRTFEMHALVQLATRKWLEANGKSELWKQHCIRYLSAKFPKGSYENWPLCQALYPHIKSAFLQRPKENKSLLEWASLMHDAALYPLEKGNIADAISLSESAMKVRGKLLGQKDETTLDSMDSVSLEYRLAGRLKEAEKLQVQVVEDSKSTKGEEHIHTLNSMNKLALIYIDQGRRTEAEVLLKRVIDTQKQVLGEEHPDRLFSMNNLGVLYIKQQRWAEAEGLQLHVLASSKGVLDEERPEMLTKIGNLAMIYNGLGRWAEAEELLLRVLAIRKKRVRRGASRHAK